MDENYYRNLIDKVNQNEEEMWDRSEDSDEGFEDFKNLWGILSDDAEVSAEMFIEAAEICLTSFFGTTQDHRYVWKIIANRYDKALNDPDDEEEFRDAFIPFGEAYIENEDPDCIDQFTRMMHMAILAEDTEMATAIMTCAFCPEIWVNDNKYPEWSVWFAVFSNKDFSEIPHTEKVTKTIKELYSNLGDDPTLDRLQELYDEYFE